MIKKYDKFIKESQSKKISKYIDFSTFLKWYNENRVKIAKILEVDPDELATEDEILKQSSDLIQKIINPQSRGNRGRDTDSGTIEGFKQFEPLTNHIAHDILHNIYNVTKKNFESYDELDFDESENIEEIEVLAIEESLMKYFKMDYVKSDFVHQNINRLVGFLMLTIIRNDPERCVKILDGEVEPYVEVYGKQYPVKGTPFQNLYEILYQIPIDPVRSNEKIKTGQDFKNWLGYMVLYGEAIDMEDNADRANFPSSDFLGSKDFYDLTKKEKQELIEGNYYAYDTDDFPGMDFEYDFEIDDMVASEYPDLPKDIDDVYPSKEELKDIPTEIKKQLENVSDRFKSQEVYKVDAKEDNYSIFDLDSKYLVILEPENSHYDTLYITYNDEYEELDEKDGLYNGVEASRLFLREDTIREIFWEVQWDYLKDVEEEINYNAHTDDIDRNLSNLQYSDNALAITRRYFRYNDVLVNNTKIKQKDGNFTYIKDSLFDNYISLSKKPLTDNAKRLIRIFDEFRGWAIRNFDIVKKTSKRMKQIFKKEDINLLQNFDNNIRLIKDEIYNNDIIDRLENGESSVELTLNDVINTFSDENKTARAVEVFKRYEQLFNKFDTEQIFDYMKRIPRLDIEMIKKDVNRFNDMFVEKFIKDYEKYKKHFSQVANIDFEQFKEMLKKEFDSKNQWGSSLSSFNIPESKAGKLLDMIEEFVADHMKGTKLVRTNINDINTKNDIIDSISTSSSYGRVYFYSDISKFTYQFPNI